MDASERVAAARAAAAAVAQVADAAGEVHAATTARVGEALSASRVAVPGTAVVGAVGGGARFVHGVVRHSAAAAGLLTAEVLRRTTPDDVPTWSTSPRGATTVAWLGAAFGDHLAGAPALRALAPAMAVRRDGRAVDPAADPDPAATGTLVVLLHGLAGTEQQWPATLVQGLVAAGATPVPVRYNSGLAVPDNGRLLAELLTQVVEGWPCHVTRLVLVGHSMGGLVARSALAQAPASTWAALVTDLVTLGTPHGGAPLERVSHRALTTLRALDVTRPLAVLGHRRSAGIKDLRFGAVVPGHWGSAHPDDVVDDPTWHVALPRGVRHHAVVATIATDPDSVLGRAGGDGMVSVPSARGRAGPDEDVLVVTLPGTGHLGLLRHPEVADLLVRVLADVDG